MDTNDKEFEVLLPIDAAIGDFALRMGDILRVLAAAEQRPESQIYSDLLTTTADVVRIQIDDPELQDGMVPMEVNEQLAQRTRDLVLAAACAATESRAVWHKRKPNQAVDYVRKVRIGQTERGSYVLTVLSRVSPLLHVPDGMLFDTQVPFERRVIQMLATSLVELESAAEKAALSGEFASFDASIAMGVNANLCDAVAGLWGDKDSPRTLRFSFSWRGAAHARISNGGLARCSIACGDCKAQSYAASLSG